MRMDGMLEKMSDTENIQDNYYMKEALRQARKAYALGEVPIGCVIVQKDRIIARGYNRRNTDKNVLAHAEVTALRKASKKTGDWRLEDCTLYVTLEPCQMCAGAIVQARVKRVVVGAMNAKAGCAGSVLNLLQMKQFNHQVELVTGVMQAECSEMLSAFFRDLRTKNGSSGAKNGSSEAKDEGFRAKNGSENDNYKGHGNSTDHAEIIEKRNSTGHGRRRRERRMTKYKVFLWDIDGTLLNFLEAEKAALGHCFEKFELGELTDEMLARYSIINKRYWEALERGEISKQEVLVGRYKEFFAKEGLDVSKAEAVNDEYQVSLGDTCVFYDDGYELVKRFKKNIRQYAVTNGTNIAQTKKLRNSGLDQLLDGVFISDRIGFEKPSAEFFDAVFQGLQKDIDMGLLPADLKKEQILIIGDSLTSDIRGGNNAGIPTCWYNPFGKENDKGVHVDYEITNLHQLIPLSGT